MTKLWDKGYDIHGLIEDFTVGEDPYFDYRLLPADIIGSIAHAKTLTHAGLLTEEQMQQLRECLLAILIEHQQGIFAITKADEDGHTAIENRLVQLCGDSGRRIHLGRSRNDQSMLTLRLWLRQHLFRLVRQGGELVEVLLDFAERHRSVPMPGRTHMQPAMPSSVGLWAAGFAEQILDDIQAAADVFQRMDQCPLGSAAGYGSPLPLNREYSAHLLGFSRVQINMVYCGLSRGKTESRITEAADHIGISLSRLSQDIITFTQPEFAWFSLPPELCTGSSIMPQKKNPDALELMRAKAASISARTMEVKSIIRSLPSGYNRDCQQTKGPTIITANLILAMIKVMNLCVSELKVNPQRLEQAFSSEIFSTDVAIELVASGMSFREAYRQAAANLSTASTNSNLHKAISSRTSSGSAGNLQIHIARDSLHKLRQVNTAREEKINKTLQKLLGPGYEIPSLLS